MFLWRPDSQWMVCIIIKNNLRSQMFWFFIFALTTKYLVSTTSLISKSILIFSMQIAVIIQLFPVDEHGSGPSRWPEGQLPQSSPMMKTDDKLLMRQKILSSNLTKDDHSTNIQVCTITSLPFLVAYFHMVQQVHTIKYVRCSKLLLFHYLTGSLEKTTNRNIIPLIINSGALFWVLFGVLEIKSMFRHEHECNCFQLGKM